MKIYVPLNMFVLLFLKHFLEIDTSYAFRKFERKCSLHFLYVSARLDHK